MKKKTTGTKETYAWSLNSPLHLLPAWTLFYSVCCCPCCFPLIRCVNSDGKIYTPRTDYRFPLDLERSKADLFPILYYLAYAAECYPNNLCNVARVSGVGSVLFGYYATSHNGRWGSRWYRGTRLYRSWSGQDVNTCKFSSIPNFNGLGKWRVVQFEIGVLYCFLAETFQNDGASQRRIRPNISCVFYNIFRCRPRPWSCSSGRTLFLKAKKRYAS